MSTPAWEFIFMMFVLKLPILYLVGVVWWAIRSTPDPYEPAALVPAVLDDSPLDPAAPCTWHVRRRPIRPRPRATTRGARR